MIVVDASVVVEAVGGTGRRSLATVRRIGQEGAVAPHLLDLEVASVLRSMLLRGEIPEPVARGALRDLAALPIMRVAHGPLLQRCWELRDNVTVYDAAYVALAETTGATLLTSDRRLVGAPGIRCDVELLH